MMRSDTPMQYWSNPSVGVKVNAYHKELGKCSYYGVGPNELLEVSADFTQWSNIIKQNAIGFGGSTTQEKRAIGHIFQKTVELIDHWLQSVDGSSEDLDQIYINRIAIHDRVEFFLENSNCS